MKTEVDYVLVPAIETIYGPQGREVFAMIVRKEAHERDEAPSVSFFTPPTLSQQVAVIKHKDGAAIEPHLHNPVPRTSQTTQEVLIIRRGVLRVDFYGFDKKFLTHRYVREGDIVILIDGGHGFEVQEGPLEMIEVKQGPYAGERDKTRFSRYAIPALGTNR